VQDWRAERDPQTYQIIGAAMDVHRKLGYGYLEAAYGRALAVELGRRGIPFRQEVEVPLLYEGRPLGVPFRVDFTCWDKVVVEIKALPCLGRKERNQLVHYLRGGGFPTGLLLNFGSTSLEFQRVVGPRTVEGADRSLELPYAFVARAGPSPGPPEKASKASVESQVPRGATGTV
jgi:GxxExxY protein